MSSLVPNEHRMIVSLSDHEFISPNFLRIKSKECFNISSFNWEIVIRELEGIVIVSPILLDTDCSCFWENKDLALINFLIFEIECNMKLFMGLQVPNCESGLSGFKDHHLRLTKHGKAIHIVLKHNLSKKFAIFIEMGKAVLPEAEDTKEDKGLIDSRTDVKDLLILLGHLDLLLVNKEHFIKDLFITNGLCSEI